MLYFMGEDVKNTVVPKNGQSLNYLSQTDRYSHSMLISKFNTIVVLANLAQELYPSF